MAENLRTAPKPLSFKELEELINSSITELADQERLYSIQATQINAWDCVVLENNEKIIKLNEAVDHLENQQQQIGHDLDMITQQQRDLEQVVDEMEKLNIISDEFMGSTRYCNQNDVRRQETIALQMNLDRLLKQLGLEIVQLTEQVDAAKQTGIDTHPILHIDRIMRNHMNCLQWVDQQIATIKRCTKDLYSQLATQQNSDLQKYPS